MSRSTNNGKCDMFCNYHCSTDDCPNIQYDSVEQYWGFGIAADIGLHRIRCRDCIYYDKRCSCGDCYFYDTMECPKTGKEAEP